MAKSDDLYTLQKIDLMTAKVRRRLLQIQELLGETDALRAARAAVAADEEALHHWQGQQRDAELESQSLKKRIADTEKSLMSGAVTNPKELENLQQSLDALQRQRAAVEDKAMESLLQAEETATRLDMQRAALATLEAEWRAGQGELGGEETKMKRNFLILRKQRETAVNALDEETLAEYDRLRKRKGGVAVAAIENGECGACHVQLPTGVISAAHAENGLVYCTSCGRILHLNR